MDTLPRILKENNVSVDIITSYITIPHHHLEESLLHLVNKVCFFLNVQAKQLKII